MSIVNLSHNTVHNAKRDIKTKRLWKNYYRKKTTIVNQEQD